MAKAPTIIAKVRGYSFFGMEGATAYAELEEGDGVLLSREPENDVDSNAIRLETSCESCGGHNVGYIDRDSARKLSPWIDKGWVYTAHVVRGPCLVPMGFFLRLNPTPEVEVKCVPIQPLQLKQKRKAHAPV